jgi:hypothetical protein
MHLLEIGRLFLFGSSTSILIRADIVRFRVPFFSENSYHEDTEACYEILKHSDFGFVHQVLTFTRRENESISSRVAGYRPDLLDNYLQVCKYGAMYLSKGEYRQCCEEVSRKYYRFLGKNLLRNNSRGFWQYHLTGLRYAGLGLNRAMLGKYLLLDLLDFMLTPKYIVKRLIGRRNGE